MFAFAGIWEKWRDPSGTAVETCAILTTTRNAVTSAVHDRMPVILDPDRYDLWLDPGMKDAGAASELLKPYDARLIRSYSCNARYAPARRIPLTYGPAVESSRLPHVIFLGLTRGGHLHFCDVN
ncbi:MAG: SOS response-associated peptidase [Acidobacteriia bacterium]|nr:SOS response-associated peptidase [Terriglobia bacterium]